MYTEDIHIIHTCNSLNDTEGLCHDDRGKANLPLKETIYIRGL